MSEPNQGGQGAGAGQGQQPQVVKVQVSSEEMKTLLETQKRLEAEKKAAEEAKAKAEADAKKSAEEAEAAKKEAAENKEKLDLIAQKEFEKKRAAILEKTKTLIQDPERIKEIESKLTDPEQLMATEYMMNILEQQIKATDDAHKKAIEEEQKKLKEAQEKLAQGGAGQASGGTAPLAGQQPVGGQGGTPVGYSSYEAMIKDLREKEHSPNPEIAAMAKATLTEMMRKWAMAVKLQYKEMREWETNPKEQLPLSEIVKHERAKRQDQGKVEEKQ
jgi:hypothetical protein